MPGAAWSRKELVLRSVPRYSEGAMKKWEYRVLVIDTPAGEISEMPWEAGRDSLDPRGKYNELAKILNRTGNDGWEVCVTTFGPEVMLLILKRTQRAIRPRLSRGRASSGRSQGDPQGLTCPEWASPVLFSAPVTHSEILRDHPPQHEPTGWQSTPSGTSRVVPTSSNVLPSPSSKACLPVNACQRFTTTST